MWSRAHRISDEYEERDLGEISAANQVDQERRWGPLTALSEVSEHQDRPCQYGHPFSSPYIPQYEQSPYNVYMSPYESAKQHNDFGIAELTSSVSGSRAQDGHALLYSPYACGSIITDATGNDNLFKVRAHHHNHPLQLHDTDENDSRRSVQHVGDALPGFPSWSRAWYGGHLSADGHAYTMVAPTSGQSGWESASYGQMPLHPSAYPNERLNSLAKEERLRMLEAEFGPRISHCDEEAGEAVKEVSIGGIDADGRLVLPARRLCTIVRSLQVLLSLAAAVCGIGGFLLIHPATKAAPSGTKPSFALYAVSILCSLGSVWLFVLKPCCCNRQPDLTTSFSNGVVIPLAADIKQGKGSRGKRQQVPVINVILNPSHLDSEADDTDTDTEEDMPLTGESPRKKRRKNRRNSRRRMYVKLREKSQWRLARKKLKWESAWDILMCLLWAGAAGYALGFGKSCPISSAQGWCDLYNATIACAIMVSAICMVAIYCDVLGLKSSRRPPS